MEFKQAIKEDNFINCQEELGDLMFSLVNIARFLKIDAEVSLQKTIIKFKKRFRYIEEEVNKSNKKINKFSLVELDQLWIEAKEELE